MGRKRSLRINKPDLLEVDESPEMVTLEPAITIRADALRALVVSARANRRSLEEEIAVAVEAKGVSLIPPPPGRSPGRPPLTRDEIPANGVLRDGPAIVIDPELWKKFADIDQTIVIAATRAGYRHVYPHGSKFRFRYNDAGQSAWFGPYNTAEEAAYARATLIEQNFMRRAAYMHEVSEGIRLPPDPNPPENYPVNKWVDPNRRS